MSKEERLAFFEEQIEVEKKIVETANRIVKGVKNPLVREMIVAIALDSQKHEGMLRALSDRLTGSSPAIDETVSDEIGEAIQEHIELEAEALSQYKGYLDNLCCSDDKEKIVIKAIYEDELRHHELLRWIFKTIVQKETLIEEDMWDDIWKDAFTHGTPGG
ncbi:MAG: ferritin-like domain-containing protein [Candidatus Heimdallarchaeota archaeon]|nr:ferritin-like domain-containing protein [Candidatus Heimdallarchaeota archaeon]